MHRTTDDLNTITEALPAEPRYTESIQQHYYRNIEAFSTILVGFGSVTYAIHSLSIVLDTSTYIFAEYALYTNIYILVYRAYSAP